MITVIDLNISNIASVSSALRRLGIEHVVSASGDEVLRSDKIILPGVGSFNVAMKRLKSLGLVDILRDQVLIKKKPLLGICLGMQLLASFGSEGGKTEGLGLIKADVFLHRAAQYQLPLPHIGWNDVTFDGWPIFDSIKSGTCFYFVHSYELIPEEPLNFAYSNYGVDFVAALQKDNIIGVQFHPEKSQDPGLKLLKNFAQGRI